MPKRKEEQGKQRESRTTARRGCLPAGFVVLLILLLIGVGVLPVWMAERVVLSPYESRIYPNTMVLDENLGGFTVEEASSHLAELFAHHDPGDLILTDGDRIWRVPWTEAGMALNAHATAQRAFAAGREGAGADGEAWRSILALWLGERTWGRNRRVSPVFTIDAAAARDALERIAPKLYEPATDATLRLEGDRMVSTASHPGRALAVEATAEKIINTVTHLGPDYPFAPTYRAVEPRIVDVEPVTAQAEDMLGRQIRVTATGEHEGKTYTWSWTLGRETVAGWLRVEKVGENADYDVRLHEAAVTSTVTGLAAEPEAGDWGFPREEVARALVETFQNGGGDVAVELTPPPRIYVVQAGDRLTTIAARFGMPPGLIAEMNRGIDLNHLYVGQELFIPLDEVLTPYETVPGKRIVISIPDQRLRVYEAGQLLYDWPCSTGKKESPTYRGHFQVLSKEEMAYASQWDLQMPHFIGVYRAGGDTYNGIHALPILSSGQRLWAGNLGSRASYGCIILGVEEAETLFNWAELGVPVTIQ